MPDTSPADASAGAVTSGRSGLPSGRVIRSSYVRLKALYLGADVRVAADASEVLVSFMDHDYRGNKQSNRLISGNDIARLFEDANLQEGTVYVLTNAVPTDPLSDSPIPRLKLDVVAQPDRETVRAMGQGVRAATSTARKHIVCLSLTDGPAGTHGGITTASSLLVKAINQLDSSVEIEAYNVLVEATPGWTPSSHEISIHSARFRELSGDSSKTVWVFGHGAVTGVVAKELADEHDLRRAHFLHTAPSQTASARATPGEGQRAVDKIRLQRQLFDEANLAVFVGNSSSDYLPEAPGMASKATKIESFLFPVASPAAPIPAPSLSPVAKLLVAGRLDDGDVKGLGLAIDIVHSLAAARSAHRGREVQLQICGADLETERRLFTSKELTRCSISAFPFLERSEMWATMATTSALLMPSSADALGLVALEALAMGRPALVSSLSGISSHYVDHDADSWVLPVNDPDPWADLAWALLHDESAYARASAKAHELAQRISVDASSRVREFMTTLIDLSSV